MLELNTPSEEKLTEKLTSASLDLSGKGLKKVPKPEDAQSVKELKLDDNALQKIDNIDSFLRIEKVCIFITDHMYWHTHAQNTLAAHQCGEYFMTRQLFMCELKM